MRIESADRCCQGTHRRFNEGKCCRATAALSTADSGSPSMIKPSKLSAINIATASEPFGQCAFRTHRSRQKSIVTGLRRLDLDSESGREFPQKPEQIARWRAGILPFQRWPWWLPHPGPLRRRRRKSVRRYLMRSAEMNFSDLGKHLWPMLFDDRGRGAFDFA